MSLHHVESVARLWWDEPVVLGKRKWVEGLARLYLGVAVENGGGRQGRRRDCENEPAVSSSC